MAQPYIDPNFFRRYRRYYTYIEPIIQDPLVRGYFGLIASLILTTVLILFALSPTVNTILGLLRKIDDQKKVLSSMDDKIKNLITAQDNYSQIEDKISLLDNALPAKPAPETVIEEIVKTASASGVTLQAIQFKELFLTGEGTGKITPPVGGDMGDQPSVLNMGIPIVQFSIGVEGGSASVKTFLTKLENLPRLIRISSLSEAAPASQSLTGPISKSSATMTNVAYYLIK